MFISNTYVTAASSSVRIFLCQMQSGSPQVTLTALVCVLGLSLRPPLLSQWSQSGFSIQVGSYHRAAAANAFGSLMSLNLKGLVIIPKSVAAKPEAQQGYRRCLWKMETAGSAAEFDDRGCHGSALWSCRCQIWQSNWQPLVWGRTPQ